MLDWITSQSVQVPPAPTLLVALLPSRWRVSEREVAAVGIETPTEANQKRTNPFCTGWKLVHNSYHLYANSNTISNQVTVQRNSLRVLRPSTYGGSCGQGLQHMYIVVDFCKKSRDKWGNGGSNKNLKRMPSSTQKWHWFEFVFQLLLLSVFQNLHPNTFAQHVPKHLSPVVIWSHGFLGHHVYGVWKNFCRSQPGKMSIKQWWPR